MPGILGKFSGGALWWNVADQESDRRRIMIVKTKKSKNFTVVENAIAQNLDLSAECLGVWLYLVTKPEDWVVRISDLQKRFSIGRDKVRRILKELAKSGLAKLAIPERKEDGRVMGKEWIVFDMVNRPPENQSIGSRPPEKPTVGKTDGRKTRPLLNKDIILNKEREQHTREIEFDLEESITKSIRDTPQTVQEIWVAQYGIDDISIYEQSREFAVWWIGKQSETLDELSMNQKAKRMIKNRGFQRQFQSRWLKNWKPTSQTA